jgi:mitochondrial fission protein ELM1
LNATPAPRAERAVPDCITLPVRDGVAPSSATPVEIHLGTEAAQFRATQVFLWSIEQVRDPARVYRVHIMSELAGFERRGWTTGFTNYRFAIPHFAGGRGRAIYCDEDQIFLTDPGKLFDLELGGAGYLAISDTETSVMLIDCERMAAIWSPDDARHDRKKAILRRSLAHPGIRGALDPHWNARDQEYVPGRSHLLHYSTLHTQPWRPFPERFVYRTNRDEKLWLDLERDAIEAGFAAFTQQNPTTFFEDLRERVAEDGVCDEASSCAPAVQQAAVGLIADLGVDSILEICEGGGRERPVSRSRWGLVREACAGLLDVVTAVETGVSAASHEAVVVTGGLEEIPPEDMPWVVERLFRRATRLVVAAVPCRPPSRPLRGYPPVGTVQTRSWWVAHFEAAAVRHPDIHWQLALAEDGNLDGDDFFFRSGGRFPRLGGPTVWVLTDDRPGNTTQSIGLADELGWPYERVELHFSPTIYLPNPILGGSAHVLEHACRRRLAPPWPDLVIAAGRRTAPVSRWIGLKSRGQTKIVQLGRKGANPAEPFDLAVAPAHARLCPHPNRLETVGALTRIRKSVLEEAALQWEYLFAQHPSPRIALLVGGSSHHYSFTPEVAERLGRDVSKMAERVGGSVFVTTSRRTRGPATEALRRALPQAAHFHEWTAEQKLSENPLLGYLALADVVVVTGESESMLAEASESGKSVHIYPLPRSDEPVFIRAGGAMIDLIVALAERRPRNNRGTTRPQQGLELFCSRLVAGGYVRPHRDLAAVHETMIARGRARMFDASLGPAEHARHSEIEEVANRVCALMGLPGS